MLALGGGSGSIRKNPVLFRFVVEFYWLFGKFSHAVAPFHLSRPFESANPAYIRGILSTEERAVVFITGIVNVENFMGHSSKRPDVIGQKWLIGLPVHPRVAVVIGQTLD